MSDCPLRRRRGAGTEGPGGQKKMEVGKQHHEGAEQGDQGEGASPQRRKARRKKGQTGPDPC